MISKVTPKITLRGCDLSWLGTIALLGTGVTDGTIVLRKRLDGGTFAGSGDITLTFSGIATVPSPFSASGDKEAEATLSIDVKYDGTNAPIRVSVS